MKQKFDPCFQEIGYSQPNKFYKENKILNRPNVIFEFFNFFEDLEEEKQNTALDVLLDIIPSISHNATMLVQKTVNSLQEKTQNLLDVLIQLAIKLTGQRNPKIIDKLINFIVILAKENNLQKSNLQSVYQSLVMDYYDQKLEYKKLCTALDILQIQKLNSSLPSSYFYFSGRDSRLSLNMNNNNPLWKFESGISLCFWFFLEKVKCPVDDSSVVPHQKLFTIHTQVDGKGGGIEAYFINYQLFYRVLPEQYTEPSQKQNVQCIGQFQPNQWFFIGIEHENLKTADKSNTVKIFVNNNEPLSYNMDYPRIVANAQIKKFCFGENLVGKISSILVFNNPIGNQQMQDLQKKYQYGFQTNAQLKKLNEEQFISKVYLLHSPIRTYKNKCFDSVNNNNGYLSDKIGVLCKDQAKLRINELGGLQGILPFFYMIRLTKRVGDSNIVNELLQLLINILHERMDLQIEATKIELLKVVSNLLSELKEYYFDNDTIVKLKELMNIIQEPQLLQSFFVDFIMNLDLLLIIESIEVKKQHILFIQSIYDQNIDHYHKLFSTSQIISRIILIQDANTAQCCRFHSLKQIDIEQKNEDSKSTLNDKNINGQLKIDNIENNINNQISLITQQLFQLVEYIIQKRGEDASKDIVYLLNSFALKCQPCYYINLYETLKKILIDRPQELQNDANKYQNVIEENNCIYTFIYLMESTPYLDIKEICTNMIRLLNKQENNQQNVSDQKLSYYISSLLENINNGKKQGISPLLSTEASNEKNKNGILYFDDDNLKYKDQNEKITTESQDQNNFNDNVNEKEQDQIIGSIKQVNKKKNNKLQLNSQDLFKDSTNDFPQQNFLVNDNQIKSDQQNDELQNNKQLKNGIEQLNDKQQNKNFQVPQKPQRKNIRSFQLSNDAFEQNNTVNEEVKNKQSQHLSFNNPENGFNPEEDLTLDNQEQNNIIQKPSFKSKKKQLQIGDELIDTPNDNFEIPSQKEENIKVNQKKSTSKQGFKKNLFISENEEQQQQQEQNDSKIATPQNQFNQDEIKKPVLSNNFMYDNDGYTFQPPDEPYDQLKVANNPGFNQAPSMSNKRAGGFKFGFPTQNPPQQTQQEEVINGPDFSKQKNDGFTNKFPIESNNMPSIGGSGNFMEANIQQEEVINGPDFSKQKNGGFSNKFPIESNNMPSIGGSGNFMEAKMSSRAAQSKTFSFSNPQSKSIAPLSNIGDQDNQIVSLPKRNIKPKGLILEEDEVDQEEEQKKDKTIPTELNNKAQKQPQSRNKKPNLFISEEEAINTNNEEIQIPPQKQNIAANNKKTGRTGGAAYKKKIGGMLELNIDQVNENYIKGGCDETAFKQQKVVDVDKEEIEIAELASMCVKYLTGELKYEEYDYYESRMPNLNPKQLNGPTTVRGIKNISFSQTGQTNLDNSQNLSQSIQIKVNSIQENTVEENDVNFSSMKFNKEQSNGVTPKNLKILNKNPFNSSLKNNFLANDDLIQTQNQRDQIMNNDFLNVQTNPDQNIQDFQDNTIQNMQNEDQTKSNVIQINTDEINKEIENQQIRNKIINNTSKIQELLEQQKDQQMQSINENARCARNSWKKIWNCLRKQNGLWRPQGIQNQFDSVFDQQNQYQENNPFYYLKINKYETKNRMRPFLKLKLIEPKYITDIQVIQKHHLFQDFRQDEITKNKSFENKTIQSNNSISKLYNPNSCNKSKENKINDNKVNIEYNETSQLNKNSEQISQIPLKKENSQTSSDKEPQFIKQCQWIKTFTTRNGYLSMMDDNLVFQYQSIDQRESHIALKTYTLPDNKRLIKQWPLKLIKEVQIRRYILKRTAIEIFFLDGTCILLNFPQNNQDCEEVSQKLIRNRKKRCPNIVYNNTLDSRKLLEKTNLTQKWQNRQISNFEYIMNLNELGSRSYNDLTQYPVFPWVITDYKSDDNFKTLRDFNKSIGALGQKERSQTYQKNFASLDHSQNIPPYHYLSHYSSPEIVLQFMTRIQPFTNGTKILKENNMLDNPDKLLFSLEDSFRSATEDISDVHELIPELFYLPELFINLNNDNNQDFKKQSLRVQNAIIPQWADRNPYKFVVLHRKALESEAVSQQINNWIDLIFGYKQTGKEAENNLNVFHHLSYDQKVDLDQIKDEQTRISTEKQIIKFGQTPSQLFVEKPHLQRINKDDAIQIRNVADSSAQIKVFCPSAGKKKRSQAKEYKMVNFFSDMPDQSIIQLKWINETKLICLRRNGQITQFRWYNNPINQGQQTSIPFQCGEDKKKQISLEKSKSKTNILYLLYTQIY